MSWVSDNLVDVLLLFVDQAIENPNQANDKITGFLLVYESLYPQGMLSRWGP